MQPGGGVGYYRRRCGSVQAARTIAEFRLHGHLHPQTERGAQGCRLCPLPHALERAAECLLPASPGPACLQGSLQPPHMARPGYGGGRGAGRGGFDPAYAAAAAAGPFGPFAATSGRGGPGRGGAYWGPPEAYMGYYPVPAGPPGAYYATATAPQMFPRGRGGFFPGGKNWAGARPPPPGQPGFSSGLQVREDRGLALGGGNCCPG